MYRHKINFSTSESKCNFCFFFYDLFVVGAVVCAATATAAAHLKTYLHKLTSRIRMYLNRFGY